MSSNRTKGGFYAVQNGRKPGVFPTWAGCEEQIKGFSNARYQKFSILVEAQNFVAGTSRGIPDSAAGPSAGVSLDKTKTETQDTSDWDVVYSDGACKGNGSDGSVAGIGVWWGADDPRNLAERCPGDQTNNRAELIAILRVLETAPISKRPLLIRSDSQYSINCFDSWIYNWQANKWRTSQGETVKNQGVIRCISKLLGIRGVSGQKLKLEYVKGHSGDVGNDGADALANLGTMYPSLPDRDWIAYEGDLELQSSQIVTELATVEMLGLNKSSPITSSHKAQPDVQRDNPLLCAEDLNFDYSQFLLNDEELANELSDC